MPDDDLRRGLDVSRETQNMLEHYRSELIRWSSRINLISSADTDLVWERHILDSAQLFDHAGPDPRVWCDLGSGGGLPGIVVAILARHALPDRNHVLIESDRRKAAFLQVVAGQLDLNLTVLPQRAEAATAQAADIVSARALARLNILFSMVFRHVAPDGLALLPKGASYNAELDEARKNWSFDLDIKPSKTSSSAVVLAVSGLKPIVRGA